MTYDIVAYYSQLIALFLFLALFAGAALYAFWPGNRNSFEDAAGIPLRRDLNETETWGGR
jgi:cytochrome c oxidase cbb3-type subunit IV